MVSIGYGSKKERKNTLTVYNLKDLGNAKKYDRIILGKIGKKKKSSILKKALEAKINFDNLNYQVYDELGRLLENKRIDNTETTIDLSKNSNAKYILKISNKNEALKTYQILKQY